MDYMFEVGFLGTKAPFFMDFVLILVSFLPMLMWVAIWFAKNKFYAMHVYFNRLLFVVSVIAIGYFEYGVRLGGGYKHFVEDVDISHDYVFWVLVIHIIVASIGLLMWASIVLVTATDRKRIKKSKVKSRAHIKTGKRTFMLMFLTSLTGIWLYLLLFEF